ncbi:MAG: LysR family transcriptional regulator [Eggerthellaceae bacterium]|nr:LysR family transcriptional regulator [Eggerthellaceae bacterium]
MNLSQLHYFKKLAEVLHYTRAAQELFITQPTLSGAISSLESELEVPLFERSGRSVKLTSQGEIFYEHVCLALRALDDGVAAVRDREHSAVGSVNMGTTFTIQDDYLPSLVNDYIKVSNNAVLMKTFQGFTNYLLDQLRKGSLDVAFCGKRENEGDLVFYPVTSRELKLCVREDHPLARRESVSFSELRNLDLYSYRRGAPIGEMVFKLFQDNGVDNVKQVYDDDVSMGSFISFSSPVVGSIMLDSLALRLFSNVRLVKIDEVPERFYHIYMVYNKKHAHSRAVKDFIQFVMTYQGNDVFEDEETEAE